MDDGTHKKTTKRENQAFVSNNEAGFPFSKPMTINFRIFSAHVSMMIVQMVWRSCPCGFHDKDANVLKLIKGRILMQYLLYGTQALGSIHTLIALL